MKMAHLISISLTVTVVLSFPGQAESVKFVQWWDKYTVTGAAYRSWPPNSVQYQDVNKDNIYDDAVVWYPFSLLEPLNPRSPKSPYSITRPSAIFYGGMIGRYTNASHLLKENGTHIFSRFSQSTVQSFESAIMCTYSSQYPEHTGRIWKCPRNADNSISDLCWGDMTLFISGGQSDVTTAYEENQNIETTFSALFIWKKQDFINGGNRIDKVVFDETSKLSVDFTGRTSNIEEVRFIVQDGQQLWMSEATAVADEAGKVLRKGINGMEIDNFKGTFSVKLTPKNSRWAVYDPVANDKEVEGLVKELKEFTPQKSAESDKKHQEDSQKFLQEVNKMEFNAQQANFIEHPFENVQAVGIYAANYQFVHRDGRIWFTFDNFQAYATGPIPEKSALASGPQGESIPTETTLTGGISVNCKPPEQTVRQCVCDRVDIQGELTVENAHVGQVADIVVYAIYKTSPESLEETFYMLDKDRVPHLWDKNPKTLMAFQEGITLQSKHPVSIYSGSFVLNGFLRIFFGYRLPEGTVVVSQESIDTHIFRVIDHKNNEKPYCEAIREQCPLSP